MVTLETQEGSAYGAALLALVGTGVYASVPEVSKAAIREVDSVSPQPDAVRIYACRHQSLYPVKAYAEWRPSYVPDTLNRQRS